MPASSDFCLGKSAAGRAHRNAVLAWVLVVPLWILSVQDAYPQQDDLAALDQRVIQLHQAGQNAEAILLAEKAVNLARTKLGPDNKDTGKLLSVLGELYRETGRFAEAESALKKAATILERGSNPNLELAQTLNSLAGVYLNQNMFSEAEELFKRALAIYATLPAGKPRNIWRGNGINNLAVLYGMKGNASAESGQPAEANLAYDQTIAMINEVMSLWSKEFGPTHQNISVLMQNRGEAFAKKKAYEQAEKDLRDALRLRLMFLPAKNPQIAATENSLANVLVSQKKFPEAEQLLLNALTIRTEALGVNHPSVARNLNALSLLYVARGDTDRAVDYSRKATAAVVSHAATETLGVRQQQGAGGLVEQNSGYFVLHVANLAAAAKGTGAAPRLGGEAFETAQWAVQSTTAAAVNQLGLRLASSGDAMAALIRENQDLSARWRDRDKLLVAALSKPENQQDRQGVAALRREIAQLDEKLRASQARLEKEFPDYVALSNPRPVGIEGTQKLLAADEAMVFFLSGDSESYVFALTHDAFEWHTLPIGKKDLAEKIGAFRRGLDVGELARSIEAGKPVLFNLDLAYQLYSILLGPVEALIKDKHNLGIVPSGSLTALPFHLLVTEKPMIAASDVKDLGPYRDAAWLLRRHAVAVLPSVASLKALRSATRSDQGTRPFIGFGDPVFHDDPGPAGTQRGAVKQTVARTRAYSDYWRGGQVDRGKLADALPRLEDTADEIKTVAAWLGASTNDIYLGEFASEATVKRIPLANYRVVYFATHGLVAGDVKGLGEPALALTIPKNPTGPDDDGLLTASEVTQLKLNADWVILSACNTMAGDTPGAEALSGLARAFFYAGTRALLVSHWTVDSMAATRLTISTFEILAHDPTIGRAEGLRRAMLAYMADPSEPRNAYPAYWGPFSVIGEGTVR
jgi:CHAT domain-containing protein/tetratricopeptide (TPR) repeat protein